MWVKKGFNHFLTSDQFCPIKAHQLKPSTVNQLVCVINTNKAKYNFPGVCHVITALRFNWFRWSKSSIFSSGEMKWNIQYNKTAGFIHIKVHINICTFWTNTGRLCGMISHMNRGMFLWQIKCIKQEMSSWNEQGNHWQIIFFKHSNLWFGVTKLGIMNKILYSSTKKTELPHVNYSSTFIFRRRWWWKCFEHCLATQATLQIDISTNRCYLGHRPT